MKPLKYEEVRVIQLNDWDYFVKRVYGKIYAFQQQDGCQPRGTYFFSVPDEWYEDFEATEIPYKINGKEMGVSFETWLNTDPEDTKKYFEEPRLTDFNNRLFWYRNFYPDIGMIINDLHSKGLLESGEYMINIDW